MTKSKTSITTYQRFFIVMGIVCLAAIVLNLVVRRGPVRDATAVDDLRSISGSVENYYSNQAALPSDLADVKASLSTATWQRIHNYEYLVIGLNRYRLCATFTAASPGNNGVNTMPYPMYGNTDPGVHQQGHQCFEFSAGVSASGGPKPL